MGDMVEIKKEKYEGGSLSCCEEPYYPYGTSLDLRDELVDDLNVGALAVGDVVEVRAFAVVTSKSEHQREDQDGSDSSKNLSIQLTQMKVRREEDDNDRVKTLYGG